MTINKSEYDKELFYLGYDDRISDEKIIDTLRYRFGLEDGSDFDGIERRDCDIADAHTEDDAETISELIGSYDTVERVYLRPSR